jgi:hypothetical protein
MRPFSMLVICAAVGLAGCGQAGGSEALRRIEALEARVALLEQRAAVPAAAGGPREQTATADEAQAIVRPCDRPRPYKDWSNAELSAAMVETMGTDASLPFITEAGCRQ